VRHRNCCSTQRNQEERVYRSAYYALATRTFRPAVQTLALGHDVAGVRTDAPDSSDREVLARAMAEGRTVMTFDKGFGALAFRAGLPASCGVILFRCRPPARAPHLAAVTALKCGSHPRWALPPRPLHFSLDSLGRGAWPRVGGTR
jgi:predicted nuclease of predicted toxin-antitoxin system